MLAPPNRRKRGSDLTSVSTPATYRLGCTHLKGESKSKVEL
ncbi:hypothetical protein Z948_362 [Sulfitobacter donghicola DSW-25 = KCTC 12864 = JCM 14565]|nr:hypothetical protein Z948_362 [Sulfitobacter donghicola DSW-25 = KCTC 12864 = JCM 14565]